MTTDLIRQELSRFLGGEDAEVLALSGKWGIGKTYSWNKFLQQANNQNGISRQRYAYVSLFGITSLNELKYTIFEQSINCKLIGKQPTIDTLQSNTAGIAESLGRKSWRMITDSAFMKNASPALDALAFFSVRDTLICLDDLERRGRTLSALDILGLVSFMKEQRNCKVAILLNANEDGLEEFNKYREKVVDIELHFSPTAKESAEIAFGDNQDLLGSIRPLTEQLNITNIRTLKKIERMVNIIKPLVQDMEPEVFEQAVHLLVLFVWCHLRAGDDSIPTLEYVESIEYKLFGLGPTASIPEHEKVWNMKLQNYGFRYIDEFGTLLARLVRSGYVTSQECSRVALGLDAQIKSSKAKQSFSAAWSVYHDSFADDQELVVKSLFDCAKDSIDYITPLDLNSAVRLFRELGDEERADELIRFYVESRSRDQELLNLSKYSFSERVTDQKIRDAFEQAYTDAAVKESPREVLLRLASSNGWNPEDEIVLAGIAPETLYQIFKEECGPHLESMVNACLQFGTFVNSSERQKQVAANATVALRRIAGESRLNALRISKFGISAEDV